MNNSVQTNFRNYFPLILIGIISLFLLFELYFFLNSFLGAIIMYVLLRPYMERMLTRKKMRPGLAASVLMVTSFLVILVPILFISYMLVDKMTVILNESSFFYQSVHTIDEKLKTIFGRDLLSVENLKAIQEKGTMYITRFLGDLFGVLADIVIMYFVLFYMLVNTGKLEKAINKYLPLSDDDIDLLGNELKEQTRSNVIGAPLLALVQGICAWIGYMIFGIPDAFFWGMMTGFFSFIPLVGCAIIWAPAAIFQFTFGAPWQGIGIVIYGILVIGTIDNILRFILQKKFADVHPIITVFGVIIGLRFFGVPGIIFGPLLLSWFVLLIKIYRKDFVTEPVKGRKKI